MQLNDIKTALFGFNKNDVCEYISKLNAVYEEKERQLRQEQRDAVETLNRKNESLNHDMAALSQENTELVRERDALVKRVESLTGEIEKMASQVEQMRDVFAAALKNAVEQLDSLENQMHGLLPEQNDEE